MEQQHYRVANGDVYICLICKDQPQVGKGRYAWESHEKNKKHQLNVARVRYYSNNPPSNSQDISASPAAATSSTSSTNNGEANMTATITSHHSSEESIAPETILLDRSKRKRDDSDSDGASDVGGGRKIHQLQDLEDDNPWVLLNDSASNDAASSASASNDGLQINVRTEPSPFQHQLATLKTPRPEWIPSDRVYEKTFPEMLHREILDFVQYVSPSQNDHNAREFLVGRFRSAVHQLWGHPSCKRSGQQWCDLLTFGSFRTRTYLPDGDMDLTVVTNRSGAEQVLLGELRDMILKRGYCTKRDIIALYNARVPIIKFTESRGGMDVDLSVNKQSGLESVSIIQAYLDDARLGAVLRHLIFLLKQLLHQSGLDEPFTGGIGSYALAIMIIFYLKTSDVATDPENEDLMDFVHILFLGWLEYFGVEFDYSQYSIVISKDPGGQASLSPRSDNDFTLSIIDPQNPSNDVTKNARQIRQIRSTLANAHSAIMSVYNECVVDEKPLPTSILSAIISIPSRYKKIRSNIEKMAPILYQSSDSITGMVMNQHTERMVKLCRQTMEQLEATYVASDQLNRGKYNRSRGSGHQRRQHYNY